MVYNIALIVDCGNCESTLLFACMPLEYQLDFIERAVRRVELEREVGILFGAPGAVSDRLIDRTQTFCSRCTSCVRKLRTALGAHAQCLGLLVGLASWYVQMNEVVRLPTGR